MKSRNSFYTITGPLETDAKLLPVSKPTLALHRAGKSALGHVWTAPGWQGLSSRFAALVGAAMCPAF
jgi:hypothetical protein